MGKYEMSMILRDHFFETKIQCIQKIHILIGSVNKMSLKEGGEDSEKSV